MSAGILTKSEGARWFESMRDSVLANVAESNRAHLLTAFRVMAWEDLAWGRPFGLVRMLVLGVLRPKALRDLLISKQTALMHIETPSAAAVVAPGEPVVLGVAAEVEKLPPLPKKRTREEREAEEAREKAIDQLTVIPAMETVEERGHGGRPMTMREIVEAEG